MSKQVATEWVGTGEAAADQRLEPAYWRTRVFRNSYVRAGKLHRVRGWSAKIQHQGVRRTISLGAVDQDVAAAKAASLFAQIQQHGWPALGQREGTARPGVTTVPGGDPRRSVDYWRLRLVERKYRSTSGGKPELSCRIEHDGTGCYFPLGTLNEAQAAEESLRIFNCVIGEGWDAAAARHRRELTLALFWFGSPFCCTYTTIHTCPGEAKRLASLDAAASVSVDVFVVEPDRTVASSLQELTSQALGFVCRETVPDIGSLRALDQANEPGLLLVNRGLPGFSGEELDASFKQRFPDCPVVPFATFEDSEQLFNSTAGSLYGYYLHRTPPGRVLHLLEENAATGVKGKPRLNPANLSRRVRQYFKKQVDFLVGDSAEDTLPHLTPREHQVMTHLSRGALDKEIAELLQISAWTVHNHLKNIYEKLGVQNRTEAVMAYLQK
ncbi:MAG: response regulator transcription factor [Verrucomicrobiota bacterium]|jgi:DNA-binding NarL/FixJ family response regulator|nr:response regulator transcription factor [Verrucomicrobiota bacterium]MDP7293092.1 response regulator transcription factor [Verrucomicrobiota bacterium]MDP7440577.1 response regulator transcription factor [Verrucomicrobiota bacterium]MEE1543530.1 response regulator transcription factor [Alphaproteobacteria bacterium]|tara:strand:- start:1805 stop:3124 length:1320 start_codon:yes stop_codon:yes gene_type:complete